MLYNWLGCMKNHDSLKNICMLILCQICCECKFRERNDVLYVHAQTDFSNAVVTQIFSIKIYCLEIKKKEVVDLKLIDT